MIKGYQVKQRIEQQHPELSNAVYPGFTTKIDSISIIYNITNSTGGVVGQDRLEIRIIDADYDTAEEYKQKIINLFSTEKKNTAVVLPTISFTGSLAGGGFLFRDDLQMWELTAIFILNTKERD